MLRTAFVSVSLLLLAPACSSSGEATSEQQGAVVDGTEAKGPELDAVVALYTGSGLLGAVFCSGVLVPPDVVLSAEHCVQGMSPGDIEVRIGPMPGDPNKRAHVRSIEHVVDGTGGYLGVGSDLSFLVLTDPVQGVAPIPVLHRALDDRDLDQPFIGVGYGSTTATESLPSMSSYRLAFRSQVTQTSGRPAIWAEMDGGPSGQAVMDGYEAVARPTGKAFPCGGDSGGPYLEQTDGGGYVVVGIQSAETKSKGSCIPNFSIVATFGPRVQSRFEERGIATADK